MTEGFWGRFPLELDSELIFLGATIGIAICVFVFLIYKIIERNYFYEDKETRRKNKIEKHMRKYHPEE